MSFVSQVIAHTLDHEPPFFHADKCLNRRQTKHPCTLCHDRCPAGILPENPVITNIDWSVCIGCGICITACPARCFAPGLRQQRTMALPAEGKTVSFACISTKEPVGERQVECLCALPWEWLAALSMRVKVKLYTGECEHCKVEGCREQLLENLQQLHAFLGAERFEKRILLMDDPAAMKENLKEKQMDRRGLFGMVGRNVKTSVVAGVNSMLPTPKEDPARDGFAYRRLLADMVRADCVKRTEKSKAEHAEPDYPQHDVLLPDFNARCHGCGVCMRVCPHQALSIEKESQNTSLISIEPWKCTGCGLCEAVCLHKGISAIEMTQVYHLQKQGHVRVHHECCQACGAVIPRTAQDKLCIACSVKKKNRR